MAELSPEEKQAAFASQFKGTTNLAQRRRYQEQIDNYEMQQRSDAQHQYERALSRAEMRDPLKAEANQLGQQREARLRGEAIMRNDRFAAQDAEQKRQHDLRNEIDRKRLELEQNKIKIAQEKTLRDLEIANRIQTQSNNVEQKLFELQNSGIHEGSREWAQATTNLLLENPYLPREMRASILKGARVDINPDKIEMYRPLFKNGQLRITSGPNGDSFTFSEAPPSKQPAQPVETRNQLYTEYNKLLGAFNKESDVGKEVLGKQLENLRAKISNFEKPSSGVGVSAGVSAPSQVPVTPQPATEPTSAESPVPAFKGVFKDGKILPAE